MKIFAIHFFIAFLADYILLENQLVPLTYNALSAVIVFLAVFFLLWLSSFFYRRSYFRKLPKAVNFFFFFLKETIKSNIKIAYYIITPRYILSPAIIALPLDLQTDGEITLMAILISLTPGTLSLDVSNDRKTFYVHALYADQHEIEHIKHVLKFGFERRILELTA